MESALQQNLRVSLLKYSLKDDVHGWIKLTKVPEGASVDDFISLTKFDGRLPSCRISVTDTTQKVTRSVKWTFLEDFDKINALYTSPTDGPYTRCVRVHKDQTSYFVFAIRLEHTSTPAISAR
jgi:hypothetical protein